MVNWYGVSPKILLISQICTSMHVKMSLTYFNKFKIYVLNQKNYDFSLISLKFNHFRCFIHSSVFIYFVLFIFLVHCKGIIYVIFFLFVTDSFILSSREKISSYWLILFTKLLHSSDFSAWRNFHVYIINTK